MPSIYMVHLLTYNNTNEEMFGINLKAYGRNNNYLSYNGINIHKDHG